MAAICSLVRYRGNPGVDRGAGPNICMSWRNHKMSSRVQSSRGIRALTAATAAAVLALVLGSAQTAAAKACSSTIVSCGCTISKKGLYMVGADLDASQGLTAKGDCIDISVPDVTLEGNGFDVDGDTTGKVGIRILSTAGNAVVADFEFIFDWVTGIEDDGNNAQITFYDDIDDNGTGIFLNGVNKSVLNTLDADDNSGPGIVISGGVGDSVLNFDTDDNGADGVLLNGASKASLTNFDSDDNSGDGVDVLNGGGIVISDFDAEDNGADGIFVQGTSSSKVTGAPVCIADDNGG